MRQDNKSDQETAAFNALRSNTDLAGRPIGLILTHVDQLMEQEPADPADPTGCVPLLSRRTFPQGTGYRPAQMNARLALEHYLVTRTHSLGRYLDGQTGFRGFMVKSCEKEGGIQNFDSPINVLDPLVWALNTLGIFPLPDTQTDQA
jgi:hypothetical protein